MRRRRASGIYFSDEKPAGTDRERWRRRHFVESGNVFHAPQNKNEEASVKFNTCQLY